MPGLPDAGRSARARRIWTSDDALAAPTSTRVQWRETASLRLASGSPCAAGSTTCSPTGPRTSSPTLPNLARRYPTPLEMDARTQNPWHQQRHRLRAGVLEPSWCCRPDRAADGDARPARGATWCSATTERFVLEPRLAARWQASERTAFTAAGGHLPQAARSVLGRDGRGASVSPTSMPNGRCTWSVGVEQGLGPFETKLEGFYVRRDKLPSPTDEVRSTRRQGRAGPVPQRRPRAVVRRRADGAPAGAGGAAVLGLGGLHAVAFAADAIARASQRRAWISTRRSTRAPRGWRPDRAAASEYLSPFDQTHILTAVGRLGAALEHVARLPLPAGLGQPDHAA